MNKFQNISDSNVRKTWFLISIFSGIIITIGWFLADQFQNNLILYGSIGFSLISTWVSYFFSDKMAIKSSGSKPIDLKTKDGQRLNNIVSDLVSLSGIPKPKIFIMNEDAINAFATGRNPKNASVSVTKGALEKLNDNELKGVLSHELTHVINRDILIMTIVVSLAGILTFFIRMFNQIQRSNKKSPLSPLATIFLITLAPITVSLIRSSVSRKREYMADAGGAMMTHNPEYLADALEKIKLYSKPMKKKSLNTSHLFISSPYRSDIAGIKLNFLDNLFSTHPPLEDRIKVLRNGGRKDILK